MTMKTQIIQTIFAFSLVLLGLNTQIHAQEEAEEEAAAVSFSGSVDAYFRSSAEAPATSFANLNGFALGMVNLVAAHEGKKAGFVGDLVFGPRGQEAVFNSDDTAQVINQLYAY